MIRLSEAQLSALGVDTNVDMVEYAVIDGILQIE